MVAEANACLVTEPDSLQQQLMLQEALVQLFCPRLGSVMADLPSQVDQSLQDSQSSCDVSLHTQSNRSVSDSSKIFDLVPVPSPSAIARLSPTALAYIGDAVYELHTRSRLLFPPQRQQDYHRQVVAQVRAEQQASALEKLEPLLTTDEKDWVRRGRNSVGKRSRHSNPVAYQNATAFETLIGYLFLIDPIRLASLFSALHLDTSEPGDGHNKGSEPINSPL